MSNTRFWCEYSLYENCFLYIETGAHYKAKNQPNNDIGLYKIRIKSINYIPI